MGVPVAPRKVSIPDEFTMDCINFVGRVLQERVSDNCKRAPGPLRCLCCTMAQKSTGRNDCVILSRKTMWTREVEG